MRKRNQELKLDQSAGANLNQDANVARLIEALAHPLVKSAVPLVIIAGLASVFQSTPENPQTYMESAQLLGAHMSGYVKDMAALVTPENVIGMGSLLAGLGLGLAQGTMLFTRTLSKLEGLTADGAWQPTGEVNAFGRHVVRIDCIDGRRLDKTGGAVAGTHGLAGGLGEALLFWAPVSYGAAEVGLEKMSQFSEMLFKQRPEFLATISQGAPEFLAGYALGSTINSFLYMNVKMIGAINKILEQNPSGLLSIESFLHNDGCGAQGTLGLATQALKFDWHMLTVEDLRNIPRDLLGTYYANLALGLYTAVASGGRATYHAHVVRRTPMGKSVPQSKHSH